MPAKELIPRLRERALHHRIAALEDGLRNIAGIAEQFDADAEFRTIQDIAEYLLADNPAPDDGGLL
jgi:hypothetical protein